MLDYFKRAQWYRDTAAELETMGCHQSAKRALEKAAFWDKRGARRMHTLEIAFAIGLQHNNFVHLAMRKHRWRQWRRWKSAYWTRRENELAGLCATLETAVTRAHQLLDATDEEG